MNGKKATTFILIMATGILTLAGMAIPPAPALAAVQSNTFTDVDTYVFVPCIGRTVKLIGSIHTLVTSTMNGNNISGMSNDQQQGIEGTDTVTGDRYESTGGTRESFKTSLENGQAEVTYVNNFRIIAQRQAQNYLGARNYGYHVQRWPHTECHP